LAEEVREEARETELMPRPVPSKGRKRTVKYESAYGRTVCKFTPKKKPRRERNADAKLTEEQLYAKYYE